MSTVISRLYNFVTDKTNSVKITASRVDAEMDQVIVALNRKVLCAASAPSTPINGQTWVDTANNLVKCYLNNAWVIIANYIYIQSADPEGMAEGYLWYDTTDNLLKSYNGATWDTVGDMLYPADTVQGDILYFTGEKTLARLPKDTNTSRVLANTGTNNNPAWAQVNTAMLKTTLGEITRTTDGTSTLPGGEYGFYPQIKSSASGSKQDIVFSSNSYDTPTSYTSQILITSIDTGETVYVQQRYVTASGTDHWLFLLVDINTLDIVEAYSAPDHPAYGRGGDFEEIPHPFNSYNPQKHIICIADQESIKEVKKLVTPKRSLLTLVNEDYKVGTEDLLYQPLHSGKYLTEDNKQIKEMVTKLGEGIKVRKLIKYTDEEKAEWKNRLSVKG